MSATRKLVLGTLALAAVAVAVAVTFQLVHGSKAATQQGTPAVPVTVATVAQRTVPVRLLAIGNVEPYTSVAVKARVDGQIVSVGFKEGDEVRQGAIAVRDRPAPVRGRAQAGAGEPAEGQGAARPCRRAGETLQGPAGRRISSPPTPTSRSARTRDTAAATVAADEAAIESAKLSLDYCTIRSPVTGYAGRILIQQGNLVKANDTNPLVTINQVVPIYVSFSVPEQNIARYPQVPGEGELRVQAGFANSRRSADRGKLASLDNTADTATGTIRLRAEFANLDKALWPGQFVNVVLTLYEQKDAIVAPSTALAERPQRPVRVRRQARPDRRAARREGRAHRRRRHRRRERPQAGRKRRHRRASCGSRRACASIPAPSARSTS